VEKKKLINLARKIQESFKEFYLAGGTAIMFRYEHRISFDLDFFKYKEFSFNRISKKIRKFFDVEGEKKFIDNIDFYINNMRVSFVYFPFKNIKKIERVKKLKIASDYDIFLNKIYSAGRRVEVKDVFDAAFLHGMHKWKRKEVKKDFEKKFPDQSFEIYLGALLSFKDYGNIDNWIKETLMELVKEK